MTTAYFRQLHQVNIYVFILIQIMMFFIIIISISENTIIYYFTCPYELVYAFINLFTQQINTYTPTRQMHTYIPM